MPAGGAESRPQASRMADDLPPACRSSVDTFGPSMQNQRGEQLLDQLRTPNEGFGLEQHAPRSPPPAPPRALLRETQRVDLAHVNSIVYPAAGRLVAHRPDDAQASRASRLRRRADGSRSSMLAYGSNDDVERQPAVEEPGCCDHFLRSNHRDQLDGGVENFAFSWNAGQFRDFAIKPMLDHLERHLC